jgi:hypothetical protein
LRCHAARGQRDAGKPGDRGQRREPGHDLVVDTGRRERLDLFSAATEDERITALQPDDLAAAPAVVNQEVVHLLLVQALASNPRRADGLAHEVERDEPVVDEDLALPDELERTYRDEPRIARPGANDRHRHASASSTTRWK